MVGGATKRHNDRKYRVRSTAKVFKTQILRYVDNLLRSQNSLFTERTLAFARDIKTQLCLHETKDQLKTTNV